MKRKNKIKLKLENREPEIRGGKLKKKLTNLKKNNKNLKRKAPFFDE